MNRFFFLTILCALVIPRVVWVVHTSGESNPASVAMHVHHGDHSHQVEEAHEGHHAQEPSGLDHHDGIAHNHLPAEVLSVMSLAGDAGADASAPSFDFVHLLDRRSRGAPTQSQNSLLRPPRSA